MSKRFKVTFTATVICTQIVEMKDPSMNAGWLEDDLNNGYLSTHLEKDTSIETLPEMNEVGRILASDCVGLRFEGFRVANEDGSPVEIPRLVVNPIKESYTNGVCPDCDSEIPDDVNDGDSCESCNHVFTDERPCDDE